MAKGVFKPKMPEYVRIVEVSPNRVDFVTPGGRVTLEGEKVSSLLRVLPLLNGTLTMAEIQRELGLGMEDIEPLVGELRGNALVFDESEADMPFPFDAPKERLFKQETLFFARQMGYAKRYVPLVRLAQSRVLLYGLDRVGLAVLSGLVAAGIGHFTVMDPSVVTDEDVGISIYQPEQVGLARIEAARQIMEQYGIARQFEWMAGDYEDVVEHRLASHSDLVIVCVTHNLLPDLKALSEICVKERKPFLTGWLSNDVGHVGPLVLPGRTACFRCYELRLLSNIEFAGDESEIDPLDAQFEVRYGSLPVFHSPVASYVCLEAIRQLGEFELPATLNAVITIRFQPPAIEMHRVLRVPMCDVCGQR